MSDNINATGELAVSGGHSLHWEDWGNPDATPIIHLHGGPGSGYSDKHKAIYDLKIHRVIFHDQRGCGKSTPFGETENNTTQDLIGDIETLRAQLDITDDVYIAGGSWGSTLSLAYTIAHPEHVKKLMVWSIYFASEFENNYVNEGYPRFSFPEAWKRFIDLVPEGHRANGKSVMQFYADKIYSADPEVAQSYSDEWALWESTLSSINYNQRELEEEVLGDPTNLSVAKLETHYFLNDSFMPDGYILDNIKRINHISCVAIHGRFDMCTPPINAYKLAQKYGDKLQLQWVNSGHSRSDPEMLAALQETARTELVG